MELIFLVSRANQRSQARPDQNKKSSKQTRKLLQSNFRHYFLHQTEEKGGFWMQPVFDLIN